MKLFILMVLASVQLIADAKIASRPHVPSLRVGCVATNIHAAQAGNNLVVTWSPVDPGECPDASSYVVQYTVDGVTSLVPGIPILNTALIEDITLSCQDVKIVVVTLSANNDPLGETPEEEYLPILPPVDALAIQETDAGLAISWDKQSHADVCSLTYSLSITVSSSIPTEVDTSENNFIMLLDTVNPCEIITISITAVSGALRSEPVTGVHEKSIGRVQNLDLQTVDGQVTAFFEPPAMVENCGIIRYRVVPVEEACFNTRIDVTAISGTGKVGNEASETIDKGPGQVMNLNGVITGNTITVTWDAPAGSNGCSLAYIVNYRGQVGSIHVNSYQLTMLTEACESDDVTVIAVSTLQGPSSRFNVKGKLSMVVSLDCSLSNNQIVCTWNPPASIGGCEYVEYLITYSNGVATETATTSGLTFSFVPVQCNSSWVTIEPRSGDTNGEVTDRSFGESDCAAIARRLW